MFMFSSICYGLINIHKYANEIWRTSFNENQKNSKRKTHLLPIDSSLSLYYSYYSIYDGISIFHVFASQHWTVAKETKEIIHWLDISSPKLTHSVETTFEMFSNHHLPIQYESVCPLGQFKGILQVRFLYVFFNFLCSH